ncbi:MAG: hypothetical protein ABI165_18175 [Bryobacteraceae bacterium]
MKWTMGLLAAVFLAAGCGKNIQNADAVRQGVMDYLTQRNSQIGLDLTSMDISVTSVSFEKSQARATVYFKPKGMGEGMQMNYALERKGDRWVVKGRSDTAGSAHGAGGLPPNPQALPPGHPSIDGSGAAGPQK